jgi:protein-L-isoaspartate(D-aspartate) O-methyltransferase
MTADHIFESQREAMVAEQLRGRGIGDERVLAAMGSVPREHFVLERDRRRAYEDCALTIGHGQTISQPWIVAAICQALRLTGEERVLEIGTGSGYSAAVLARLAGHILSVERVEELATESAARLRKLGVKNVTVANADGTLGGAGGPFDAIAVHAAAPRVPEPLAAQLADGGRLVIPIASNKADMLTAFVRRDDALELDEVVGPCRFVPLIGAEGY